VNLDDKLSGLNRIIELYDGFIGERSVACKRSCAHCCTCNVTMTTLEGYSAADQIIRDGQPELLDKLRGSMPQKRFQPKMTTNMLADLCARGEDILEEENDAGWGQCPVLESGECPIYGVRPFGCRCFVSKRNCGEAGYADVDDFVVTVNSIFLQFIEHLDADGYSGNLIDVLNLMGSPSHREQYRLGSLTIDDTAFVANRPISVLFVPPEHREPAAPIIKSLRELSAISTQRSAK